MTKSSEWNLSETPVSYEWDGGPIPSPIRWTTVPPLPKAVPYDGEKVWTGDWYGAPLYPGPRCLTDLRGREYPAMIDAKRYQWPTGGKLRMALWEASSEHYPEKRFAIDGILANRDKDGRLDFSTITRGMHTPPGAIILADDLYSWDVVKAGEGTLPFLKRRKRLRELADAVADERVVVTNYKRIESRAMFEKLKRQCLSVEGFGMVLRQDSPYRSGKSGYILKIKAE